MRERLWQAFAVVVGALVFVAYLSKSWIALAIDAAIVVGFLVGWLRSRGESNFGKPS